jgi:prophage maintenance system killer protein/predicted XRE-type DNA-binding protein
MSTINPEKLPIIIFENENKEVEIQVDYTKDTIWLSQAQIVNLFNVDQSVVSRHIKNIFTDKEIDTKRNMQKMHIANSDKLVIFYSLDVVLAVGYRTNSARAIRFRQWATTVLKQYLLDGYALNKQKLKTTQDKILEIQKTLQFLISSQKNLPDTQQFIQILDKYSQSLVTLNQFDEDRLQLKDKQKAVAIQTQDYLEIIEQTKSDLIAKKEATELFGKEYQGKFEAIIGAINQTFDGQDLYPTVEQKASHLLYFVIKNHAFVDGNKRIGAILFIYFLAKNQFLYTPKGELKIDQNGLVALALLIAQSNPIDKEIMIKLVINFIQE